MTTCIFLQIRCAPGTTYEVADEISRKEMHSEMYSTSGDFDLLLKRSQRSNDKNRVD